MARPSHAHFMQRAIELAKQGRGRTSPNPMVGCVIAHQGRIVAEGYHRKAGTDHAEIAALKKLRKADIPGATLYVTMEPCSIDNRTPACVPQVIASGIRRVVVGARDPNPKVNGNGIRLLKEGQIEVIEGVMGDECAKMNRPFEKWIQKRIPYVTLKAALSLDGKIAAGSGDSKWITGAMSRQAVQHLRDEVDAILIGSGTLKQDDPLLTVRLSDTTSRKQPIVVVVDKNLESVPDQRKLFDVPGRQVIVATTSAASAEKQAALRSRGITVWTLDVDLAGRVDLENLLKALGEIEVTHLLVEGGSGIFSSFVAEKRCDRLFLFLAPKLLGGHGFDWLSNLRVETMQEALPLRFLRVEPLGGDLFIEAEMA